MWTYKITPLPAKSSYYSGDVTVVISTLADKDDFRRCLATISACCPATIIVVAPCNKVFHVRRICSELDLHHVQVLGTSKANKRLQMIQGLKKVRTAITVFADDDVFWAPTLLAQLLAPFENAKVGAVGKARWYCKKKGGSLIQPGGLQTLERKAHPNCWDFLGTIYLERRKFELAATQSMDGGVGCLSGRSFAIRTGIIQTEQFCHEFWEEKWLGVLPLIGADDDNFITRYLVNHGWDIVMQLGRDAELTTTLEGNWKFLAQCVRWRRTTWRSNVTSLYIDQTVWR